MFLNLVKFSGRPVVLLALIWLCTSPALAQQTSNAPIPGTTNGNYDDSSDDNNAQNQRQPVAQKVIPPRPPQTVRVVRRVKNPNDDNADNGSTSSKSFRATSALRPVDPQRQNAIEDQMNGNYPIVDRLPGVPLGTVQRSWDRPVPAPGQRAPGIVSFDWTPSYVMAIRTRDYMITTLNFPAFENIKTFYLGDPHIFEAQKVQNNILAVRSTNPGADTNLTVIGTSGNVYNFYVRSEGWNTEQVSDLTVYIKDPRRGENGKEKSGNMLGMKREYGPALSYTAGSPYGSANPYGNGVNSGALTNGNGFTTEGGGNPNAGVGAPGQDGVNLFPPDYIRQIAFRPENLKFDMKIYAKTLDDAEIAPERVFNDGVFTYLDYGKDSDSVRRPVVYLVIDGIDTLVNTRTAGPDNNVIIVEGVGNLTLRNGQKVICIRYNVPPRRGGATITTEVSSGKDRRSAEPNNGSGADVGISQDKPDTETRRSTIPKFKGPRASSSKDSTPTSITPANEGMPRFNSSPY